MSSVNTLPSLTDSELSRMQVYGKVPLAKLYLQLYQDLIKGGGELTENQLLLLDRIQKNFGLSRNDIGYEENVLPYYYVSHVKKTNQLPVPKLKLDVPVIFKKGELAHYGSPAVLKEDRVVSLGYQGASHGVSIRIMKGVSYKVGSHRGYIVKENQLVQTSAGALVITNQRLFLVPTSGNKPVSIPLDKIQFYRCSENALEVYKEGREKGYFFIMQSGPVEIFGICLGTLIRQEQQ